jgi:hypothetical protein
MYLVSWKKTVNVAMMRETPKENSITIPIRSGRTKIFKLKGVPERIKITKRGTREKTKWISPEKITERGKIDFGRYILLIRLRLPVKLDKALEVL